MLTASSTGLLTGLGLIVAIGSQNAFVLRQGLLRRHVGAVVAICTASDVVLIAAGVGGVGAVVAHAGWVVDVVRWLGVAFLTGYGITSLLRARRSESLRAARDSEGRLLATAATALALTWLNPHVYLDTVLVLGSVAATHGDDRWWFGAGACVASLLWFVGLGYGARLAQGLLARPRAWQVLDVVIGLTMLGVAAGLALGA